MPFVVTCLGWCNKKFVSHNKIYKSLKYGYCSRCLEKKRKAELSRSGMRNYRKVDESAWEVV